MFDSTVTNNKFNYSINAVSGTLRKSHPKSKVVLRTLSKSLWIFDKDTPRLDSDTYEEIVVLQVMLIGNNQALVEYVLKEDFKEVENEG